MATNDIGFPFQARGWYWIESTFGGGPSGTTLPISCYIQSVKIGTGDKTKPIRDISTAQVVLLMEQVDAPTLSVEYHPQIGDTLLADSVDRTSCCSLQSLSFYFESNKCMPADDSSCFFIEGAKADSVKISGSRDEPWTVTIDFLCKSMVTVAEAGADVAPDPLAGAMLTFNMAGSLAFSAGQGAYVTNSVDISISHNLSPLISIGESTASFIVEGGMDISGSVDITLDGGGGLHMTDVLDVTPFTLTIGMGGAGAPEITIPGCRWDNSVIDLNVSGEAMIESAPFTSAPQSCVTDGACITLMGTV